MLNNKCVLILINLLIITAYCENKKHQIATHVNTSLNGINVLDLCPIQILKHCICRNDYYQGYNLKENRKYFIINCTNTNLNDMEILKHLPEETEILIFSGNRIETLPKTIFKTNINYDNLALIDFSNNQIENIKSKSFHNVKNLKKLILNHNKLKLSSPNFQAKMFNNFEHLEELYLKDAFQPKTKMAKTISFIQQLNHMFNEAQLTHLKILNLEENQIKYIPSPFLFCSLPSLQKVYLAKNLINEIQLNFTCTPKLRLLDLTENQITYLNNNSLAYFDVAKTIFHLNLSRNPFRCDCNLNDFVNWLKITRVWVLGRKNLLCKTGFPTINEGKAIVLLEPSNLKCDPNQAFLYGEREDSNKYLIASYSIIILLIFVLCILIGVFIVSNKDYISMFLSNMRTSIASPDGKCDYSSLKKASLNHHLTLHKTAHPNKLNSIEINM